MNTARRLAVLACLTLPAACGSPPQPEPKVATLQTTGTTAGAGTPASTATPAAPRPRQRLDMTPAELDALFTTYSRCLEDHGYKKPTSRSEEEASKRAQGGAEAACKEKQPLPAWEYDPANPESMNFIHKLVQCLRNKGVRYVDEVPAGTGGDDSSMNTVSFGGTGNDSDSITKGLQLTPVCEKELSVGGSR